MSINLLINRRPSKIYLSDSCPHGLGGFSCLSGRAWRIIIPDDLIGKVSNNLLEFLAEVTCICIDIVEGNMVKLDCCLSFGDNTSAISWIHLSNFSEKNQSAHQAVARKLANLCISSDLCMCSQHFKGAYNVVADSLSRDFHAPSQIITNLFKLICPNQMPQDFHIFPVPQEIESRV